MILSNFVVHSYSLYSFYIQTWFYLCSYYRQLSSLSKHAEDMFGELTREATGLAERTNVLQARIDRLAIKVTQLDSGVEEGSSLCMVMSYTNSLESLVRCYLKRRDLDNN